MLAVMGVVDPSVGAASFLSLKDKAAYETTCVACREEVRSPFIHHSFTMCRRIINEADEGPVGALVRLMFRRGRRHKNLTSLVLTESLITDESLMTIARCCPNLTSLDVRCTKGLSEDALIFVMNQCRRLKSIVGCRCIGDQTIEAIAANCKNLTSLDVSYTGGYITDMSIASIAAECPKLTELNVALNHHVTIQSLRTITTHCPRLTFVDFEGCAKWRDIEAVLVAYPNIKTYNPTTLRYT
jgi:hypothetical protein